MASFARRIVSKEKKRYKAGGFDIDLSYITKRIIAMGYPSVSTEALYRNPMSEVIRFLEHEHRDHYKIYNLCAERCYDPSYFHGRVEHFPFYDHNAPPFELIQECCENLKSWLDQHPDNVAVIHCKAGKGRTGLMICCFLIYLRTKPNARTALPYYASMRTRDGNGVTIPSQKRYVQYFSTMINAGLSSPLPEHNVTLRSIRINNVPVGGLSFSFKIRESHNFEIYNYKTNNKIRRFREGQVLQVDTPDMYMLPLKGDLKFIFKNHVGLTSKEFLHFWINACFIVGDHVKLSKHELDGPHRDIKHKRFPQDFTVELFFESSEPGPFEKLRRSTVSSHDAHATESTGKTSTSRVDSLNSMSAESPSPSTSPSPSRTSSTDDIAATNTLDHQVNPTDGDDDDSLSYESCSDDEGDSVSNTGISTSAPQSPAQHRDQLADALAEVTLEDNQQQYQQNHLSPPVPEAESNPRSL
eukprot:gb/GECH01008235.1/.p1 GENE.gb/GECH01008235.1/~~gb/GECH01008235.1/.p1  ORF type:complete len:470 (+),score=68.08 gb/GECH01008235.1/:1-1410(+)